MTNVSNDKKRLITLRPVELPSGLRKVGEAEQASVAGGHRKHNHTINPIDISNIPFGG